MIADASINAFWVWLRAKYDFSDRQIRKYTFNLAPFLVNPKAIQQGYVTSEPYTISTRGGFEPQVFLLSDFGYPSYAAMVLAQNRLIEDRPELVQAFVNASIETHTLRAVDNSAAENCGAFCQRAVTTLVRKLCKIVAPAQLIAARSSFP